MERNQLSLLAGTEASVHNPASKAAEQRERLPYEWQQQDRMTARALAGLHDGFLQAREAENNRIANLLGLSPKTARE